MYRRVGQFIMLGVGAQDGELFALSAFCVRQRMKAPGTSLSATTIKLLPDPAVVTSSLKTVCLLVAVTAVD